MSYTERFTEVHYPLAYDYADSFAAGVHTSSYVSLQNYHRAVVILNVGDMAALAELDASVRQATDTSGTGVTTITGKSITQLTQASGDGDDIIAIEIQTEELDVDNGYDCICFRLVLTGAVELSYIIYGIEPRFPPTGTTNWTEVVT